MRTNEVIKKVVSILFCLCMLVQNCPVVAFAADRDDLHEPHTAQTAEVSHEMAVAKVTSGGVDTYYETLSAALAAAVSGDTVSLCADVDIKTTEHTIPEGVTFSGGEYTISGEGAGWVYNRGIITDGKFAFVVHNRGTIKGGEFEDAVNSNIVIGGSFKSIDCNDGSSLSGPVRVLDLQWFEGCSVDLSEATVVADGRITNGTAQELPVSSLHLPEGYALQINDSIVSVIPPWIYGYIVEHAHTYGEEFDPSDHWAVCACGATTERTGHSYTYAPNGENHTVGCEGCGYTGTGDHTMNPDTGKCVCGEPMAVAAITIGGNTTYAQALAEAIEAVKNCTAADNAKITLLKDVDLGSEGLTVNSGVFTIDLNDCAYTSVSKYPLTIKGATVTIEDNGANKTGAITGEKYAVNVTENAVLTITGGIFSANENSVIIVENARLDVTGGTISSQVNAYGVFGFSSLSVVNISGNPNISGLYGVRVDGTAYISGGTILGKAYGVCVTPSGTATITGGTITGKSTDLYNDNIMTLKLADGKTEGTTFPGGISAVNQAGALALNSLLGEGLCYWAGDTMLTVADDVTKITDKGDITVKTNCTHPENSRTEYTPLEEGKHSYLCALCNNTFAEEHTVQSEATCIAKAVCKFCGEYGEKDTTNHAETVAYDNGFCPHGCYEPAVLNDGFYEISNPGQLYWFAAKVNAGENAINGKLMENIVVNTGDVSGCDGIKQSGWRDWILIGANNGYEGIFEGNNKTVSGLYYNDSEAAWAGFFSCLSTEGVVRNVGVVNSYICAHNLVGGVVGSNFGKLTNCYNSGTVVGKYGVGGVTGNNEGLWKGTAFIGGVITDCYNSGTVIGDSIVAGVTASNRHACDVINCYNSGSVTGNMQVGGVVAENDYNVTNCYNSGAVVGIGDDTQVGGIAGVVNYNMGTVTNCYNFGTVTGNISVAGVVNGNEEITTNCYNYGTITGNTKIAGVACSNNGTMTNCYNLGAVTGDNLVAGVVISNKDTVTNCYNYGTITGNTKLAGVVIINKGTVTNCYYLNTSAGSGILDENDNGADAAGQVEAKTIDEFKSGEVAYLLQGEQMEQVWGQDIGTDDYPDFVSAKVYKGYTSCAENATGYTNDKNASATRPEHTGEITYTPNAENDDMHDVKWSCCGTVYTEYCGTPIYTVSSDGATCNVTCVECKRIETTCSIVAPACTVYGDGKSCDATVLVDGEPVEGITAFTYYQWMNDRWNALEAAPTDAGTYQAEILVFDDTYYDQYDVFVHVKYTIEKAELTVTANDNSITYGDAPAANGVTASGFVNGETFADLSGELTYSYSYEQFGDVGTYKIIPSGLTSDNYAITFAEGKLTVSKRNVTITAKDQTITHGSTVSNAEITPVGLLDGHSVTVTLTPSTANVTVDGTITARAAVITAGSADVTGNYEITYADGKLMIEPDTSKIAGLTTENVTSENEADIKEVQEMMENADSVKDEWNAIAETCEELLAKIGEVADATDTENTDKVENVTAENVKPEDKEALENAKDDLEKALEANDGNYTESEKKDIQEQIDRIEAAVTALENVEKVTEAVNALPESVETDDEDAAEKIMSVKEAYDALTDHEKSLMDEDVKKKLDALVAALTAYDIIEGDGSSWKQGSDTTLSFTANGAFGKFVGIKVDGKNVDQANYEAKSGSTVITLKTSYLDTLAAGEHTLTVVYTNGSADGTFKIVAKATTPPTGDSSNIMLFGSMLTVSLAGLVVLFWAARKRKPENA